MHVNTMQSSNNKSPNTVTINVGGVKHKAQLKTLESIPGTRLAILAKLQEQDESYIHEDKEYYFDRNPAAFLSILEYYRTQELHLNESICGNAMKKELEYWGIFEPEIEACCWGNYSRFLDHKETLANLDNSFQEVDTSAEEMSRMPALKRFQCRVWNALEYPSSSRGAKVLMLISIAVVLVSIITFVLESHFWFQVYKNDTSVRAPDPELYYNPMIKSCGCSQDTLIRDAYPQVVPMEVIANIDLACLCFFAIELLIRFLFAPDKCAFLKGLLNIVDLICIVPHIIDVTLERIDNLSESLNTAGDILSIIRVLRVVRVLRIFKLMKHYSAFKVLAYTIKVSTKELLLMIIFLMSGVMVFASTIYSIEKDNFTSIPIGIWWALVTMTTVGYGDRVPVGTLGYVLGCICVISGVLVIAFTVPIVVNNFTLYYSHANSRAKLPMKLKINRKKEQMKLVGVSPSFNSLPERTDTPLSKQTTDSNALGDSVMENLNIVTEEKTVGKKSQPLGVAYSIQPLIHTDTKTKNIKTYGLVVGKGTNNHELEARKLVKSLDEQNRQLLNEKRRQYMLAFKRMEEKRKGKSADGRST